MTLGTLGMILMEKMLNKKENHYLIAFIILCLVGFLLKTYAPQLELIRYIFLGLAIMLILLRLIEKLKLIMKVYKKRFKR